MAKEIALKRCVGFTLIELLVVVIVIGVLAGISFPIYSKTRENAFDREAISALKLVRVANRQYYSKYNYYYPPTGTSSGAGLSNDLSLDLNSQAWNYVVGSGGGGSTYTATAARTDGSRTWTLSPALSDPTCSGSCSS